MYTTWMSEWVNFIMREAGPRWTVSSRMVLLDQVPMFLVRKGGVTDIEKNHSMWGHAPLEGDHLSIEEVQHMLHEIVEQGDPT